MHCGHSYNLCSVWFARCFSKSLPVLKYIPHELHGCYSFISVYSTSPSKNRTGKMGKIILKRTPFLFLLYWFHLILMESVKILHSQIFRLKVLFSPQKCVICNIFSQINKQSGILSVKGIHDMINNLLFWSGQSVIGWRKNLNFECTHCTVNMYTCCVFF